MSSVPDAVRDLDSDRSTILEHERRRIAALTAGDVAALGDLVADDLVHVHGNGQIDDKAAYLHGIETKYVFHRIDRGELIVRIFGDVATVTGPLDQTVEVRGTDVHNDIKAVATQTWARDGKRWRQNTCHMGFLSVTPRPGT